MKLAHMFWVNRGQVLVAIVLLARWSIHTPFTAKYRFFDLFAGDANSTRVWYFGCVYPSSRGV